MSSDTQDAYEGIKTFFVVPDLSVMPDDFLHYFFLKGFEAYYLHDDQRLDIAAKIRVLFALFPELIIFFNIARKLGNLEWPAYIKSLKDEYGDRARIGVLYGKHIGEEARRRIERLYLYDIGASCGCIPIEYRKVTNLALLTDVLEANQANGRRKYLRAICGNTCTFNFMRDQLRFEGRILDVSVSHFSCTFSSLDPNIKMYEKIADIQFKLGGLICTVDAVLFTKRILGSDIVHVFVFRTSRGMDGLDPDVQAKVNGFICDHFERSVKSRVRKGIDEEIAKRRTGNAVAHHSDLH